ncbi:MAG TPA: hypothetical protein VFO86_11525 [Terriglobia bacterium]|nr:hypothetical protein [Terriglobia bacterium]
MERTILKFLCGAAICAGMLPVSGFAAAKNAARPKTPAIDRREHNQQERIRQGIKSGELTRREAVRLEEQEAKIRVNEKFAKADGKITPAERERLEKELNRTSQNIYEQKHDDQDRK